MHTQISTLINCPKTQNHFRQCTLFIIIFQKIPAHDSLEHCQLNTVMSTVSKCTCNAREDISIKTSPIVVYNHSGHVLGLLHGGRVCAPLCVYICDADLKVQCFLLHICNYYTEKVLYD